jgi:uncharacterized protein (TIGR02284 family)
MATMVGKEKDITKLLCDLITLDLDAIEAYEAAIARLSTVSDKDQLTWFMEDHRRHVQDLSGIVRSFGEEPPREADFKRILTMGKVVLAGLLDDEAVLRAMKSNEDDTNQAYERAAARQDIPERVLTVLRTNLADERRHWAWLEQRLDSMKAAQAHP